MALGATALAAGALYGAPPAGSTEGEAATLFAESCAGCHTAGPGPDLFASERLRDRRDAELAAIIHSGKGSAMPGFAEVLTGEQIAMLVGHLRRKQAVGQSNPPPATPQIDGQVIRSARQSFRLEVVARDLATPWGLAFLPGGRLLVTERPGRLRILEPGRAAATVTGTPAVWEKQDGGLFDVALHPDYRRNGWVYLSYSEPGPVPATSMTVIVRGRIDRAGRWSDQQVIFRAPPALYSADNSHYGSRFMFDDRRRLYFSLGDRGAVAAAQDLSSPLGKIHRVKDDGSIPRDNPFAGRAGAVASIWSYGHRNPQGLAWDKATGLLWSSEHGPRGGDEINIIEKGRNYGWGLTTMGEQPGMGTGPVAGAQPPVVHYTPRIAPSGIVHYSGDRYPGWRGNLLVAGLAGQQLRRLEIAGRTVTAQEIVLDGLGRVRTAATGPDGMVYLLMQSAPPPGTSSSPGMVVRLVPVAVR